MNDDILATFLGGDLNHPTRDHGSSKRRPEEVDVL